jgi:DHA1 family bicyclomycin/chloramphenicol resistance-like MFS transporter
MTPDAITPTAPPRAALVGILLAQLAFGLFAMTLCIPSMQEWSALLGATQAQVQLTFSGYVFAYGGFQLIHGPLSDRIGRKPVLQGGLVMAIAGTALAIAAPDVHTLIAARVLQGAGTAAGMVVSRALIQDLFDGAQRTRMMALVGMTMGLCPPLATLLGGQLHVHLGWQSNFVLILVLAVLLLVAAWRVLPTTARAPRSDEPWLSPLVSGYGRLLRERVFLLYVLGVATATATLYTFMAGAPIVLGSYGVKPQHLGWYIMAVPTPYILGNLLAARLVNRLGDRRLMALGHGITLVGLSLMLLLALAGVNSPLALVLPLTLMGAGHGLLMPPSLSGVVSVLPALAGSAAAIAGLLQQFVGALGGYVVGLVSHDDAVNLAWLMLVLGLLGALSLLGLPRRTRAASLA